MSEAPEMDEGGSSLVPFVEDAPELGSVDSGQGEPAAPSAAGSVAPPDTEPAVVAPEPESEPEPLVAPEPETVPDLQVAIAATADDRSGADL